MDIPKRFKQPNILELKKIDKQNYLQNQNYLDNQNYIKNKLDNPELIITLKSW